MAEAKILIVSDTHGSISAFSRVLETAGPFDELIHCGDFLYHGPRNCLPEGYSPESLSRSFKDLGGRLHGVLGNCDAPVDMLLMGQEGKLKEQLDLGLFGVSFHIFHGDRLWKGSLDEGICLSGHTHIGRLDCEDGIVYLNPGSPAHPTDGTCWS